MDPKQSFDPGFSLEEPVLIGLTEAGFVASYRRTDDKLALFDAVEVPGAWFE